MFVSRRASITLVGLLCAGGIVPLFLQAQDIPGGGQGPSPYGKYVVTYSGGECTTTGLSGGDPAYNLSQDGWYGAYVFGQLKSPSHVQATANCEGSITVTMTWQPGTQEPNPPGVIILEKHAYANWRGEPGGSCENGLGSPAVGGSLGYSKTGVDFEVIVSDEEVITRSIEPTAQSVANYPNSYGVSLAKAEVDVKFIPHVARVKFSGTSWIDEKNMAMIGSKIVATLDVEGYSGHNTDTWIWSSSGDNPFSEWTISSEEETSHLNSNVVDNEENFEFCIGSVGDDIEYTCQAYLGQWDETITVTGKLSSEEPELEDFYSQIGDVILLDSVTDAHRIELNGVQIVDDSGYDYCGMYSQLRAIKSFSLMGGSVKFLHIINAKDVNYTIEGQSLTQATAFSSKVWLHGTFEGSPGFDVVDEVEEDQLASFNKTPGFSFPSNALVNVETSANYTVYLMFRPEGEGSQWVPLRRQSWKHDISASRSSAASSWNNPSNLSSKQGWVVDYSHPEWTDRYIEEAN